MKNAFTAVLLIALSGHAAADEKLKRFIGRIDGDITVGADGTVKAVALKNIKDRSLEAFLVSRVKAWQFHPLLVNGNPVEASTGFDFDLLAAFDSQKKLQQIRFSDINVAPTDLEKSLEKMAPKSAKGRKAAIHYPPDGARNSVEAAVVVAVDISPAGRVARIAIKELALLNAGHRYDAAAQRFARQTFGASAVAGVRQWTWSPQELEANGCSRGCIRTIKVDFTLSDMAGWRSYLELEAAPEAWVLAADLEISDDGPRSELVRLRDDPAGKLIEVGS